MRLPPVSPAYAVTFFKIQGFTCDALIVDLTNNCLMKLQALYVSVTRVKRGADMRTLQCKAQLQHLRGLKHDAKYVAWRKSLVTMTGPGGEQLPYQRFSDLA